MGEERRSRFVAVVSTCGLLALAVLLWGVAHPQSSQALGPEYGTAFCKGQVLHDYFRPLKRLRRLRRVPKSGDLPFGPRLGLHEAPEDRLEVGSGEVGFFLTDERLNGGPLRLNWDVGARLYLIGARGQVKREVAELQRHMGRMREPDLELPRLTFPVPARPALYRVDVEFTGGDGRRLGRYSEVFRVVPTRLHVRLGVSAPTYRPGEVAYARIENFGTAPLSFGYPFAVERYDGSAWTMASFSPRRFVKPLIRARAPGRAFWCQHVSLPPDLEPGSYRFSKLVSAWLTTRTRRLRLTAEFEVVP